MEYIQGNSVATMLARKEGFSIWDLLDITRQVCSGLEQAASKGVAHHSLEAAKIMVQGDGMVKILGYGISNMSLIGADSGKGLGRLMPYCSPEQIRGEAIDLRSNVFTLGAILYEMVVGRKAFDAADPVTLVSQIESQIPANPSAVNSKIQPAVSALIMKALAKDPAGRYQSARELVDDLEKCKENGKKAATDSKKTTQAPNVAVNSAARAAAASKFVSAGSNAAKLEAPVRSQTAPPAAGSKAAAAAAGAMTGGDTARVSTADSGAPLVNEVSGEFEVSASESQAAHGPVLSVDAAEEELEQQSPRVAADPMMSEPVAGSSGTSFSDLAEMPPLKEPVFVPPVPEPAEPSPPVAQICPRKDEKPKIQPREVAQKAIHEMATVPPRLMIYSILGAVGLILVVAIASFFHVRSEDDGATAAPQPTRAAKPSSPPTQPLAPTAAAPQIEKPAPPITEAQPSLTVRQVEKRSSNGSRRGHAPAPVAIAGQAPCDSRP